MNEIQKPDPSIAIVGDNVIERYVGEENAQYIGGNALNVAIHLARTGQSTSYFGAIADDDEGEIVARTLAMNLVNTTGLVVLPGTTAVKQIRITDTGARVVEAEDVGITSEYFPDRATIKKIASATWVHLGKLTHASRLRASIATAGTQTIVSQDCSASSGHQYLDIAFHPSNGARQDALDLAEEAISDGVKLVVVKRSDHAAIAYDGTSWWEQTPTASKSLDTTGAWESFIAGFISARIRNADIQDALTQAVRAASAACQHFGAFQQPQTI